MPKTRFPHVYLEDKTEKIYIELSQGTDPVTKKRRKIKRAKDATGKPFETLEEADIEAMRIELDYKTRRGQTNSSMLYPYFIDNIFIPEYEKIVDKSTFDTKKPMLDYFKSRFEKKTLRDITVADVRNLRTYLLSQGYSNSYASAYFSTFKQTLTQAKKWRYLTSNVADEVEAINKPRVFVDYWTKEDFEQVVSKIDRTTFDGYRTFMMLWIYFNTGIRANEGTALYWEDINFLKSTLTIRCTQKGSTKPTYYRQEWTKTYFGIREIKLDADTIEILKFWKKIQAEKTWINSKYVFSPDGLPVASSTIQNRITKYAKLAGVKRIEIKGLRHSNVSYLLNDMNVDILIISKRLGHSSPEITYKYYAHLKKGADAALAQKMAGQIAH